MGLTNVAEALVLALASQGVDRIFFNPGSDTAPYQEALLALSAKGVFVPRLILCPHEAVALAAAHGRAALTARTQVVMVHVDVGTQNLGAMMHNAMRGRANVLVIAGLTPMTSFGELAGGRDNEVHWHQDVPDQTGVVRSYVKWASGIFEPSTAVRKLHRAFQVAGTQPFGPVYLVVPRETLMRPVAPEHLELGLDRFAPPSPPGPNLAAFERAAQVLHAAERPVVITARLGQSIDAVPLLVEVAERTGARVVDTRERVNFPSRHPLYCATTAAVKDALSHADAVLVVDAPVPWVPALAAPPPSATVISVDSDPLRASMPDWSFPVDVNLHCDPLLGLVALRDLLASREAPRRRPRAASHAVAEGDAGSGVRAPGGLHPRAVVSALNEVLRDDDVVVEELTTYGAAVRGGLVRDRPGTYFRSGGSGLGWAIGASLGMKLELPDRRVIVLVGDGAFLYGAPVPGFWALHAHRAPVVFVVFRNGGYAASRLPVFSLFPDGRSAESHDVVGTLFPDPPDLPRILAACGGAGGAVVRSVDELAPALEGALDEAGRGRSAVVVVDVGSPFIDEELLGGRMPEERDG